jgi:Family of unknown function (DUF6502)
LATTRHAIVLASVLRILRPLVRLLLRHGVTYTEMAVALKPVFLEAARAELAERQMPATDSAITLLSGVHRRDVREISRGARSALGAQGGATPLSLSGQVVGRWLSDARWQDAQGRPQVLPRAEFDALAESVSRDVRPRALLDELLRLGAVTALEDGQVQLAADGFAPRQGFGELAQVMAHNVGDHAAAAAANLQGSENFLEQAMFVDQLRPQSVAWVRREAKAAWGRAMKDVLREAQKRFSEDEQNALPQERTQRARFGVYFYSEDEGPSP